MEEAQSSIRTEILPICIVHDRLRIAFMGISSLNPQANFMGEKLFNPHWGVMALGLK